VKKPSLGRPSENPNLSIPTRLTSRTMFLNKKSQEIVRKINLAKTTSMQKKNEASLSFKKS